MGSNYAIFIKVFVANLSKSRRMIIDCQLNSLLENCLKTQLVGFRWADVLGLKPKSWGAEYFLINIGHTYFLFSIPIYLAYNIPMHL